MQNIRSNLFVKNVERMPAPRYLINLYKMICVALESRVRTRNGSAVVSDRRHNSIHIYNDEHTCPGSIPRTFEKGKSVSFCEQSRDRHLFIQLEHYNIYKNSRQSLGLKIKMYSYLLWQISINNKFIFINKILTLFTKTTLVSYTR